jgi:hypothetical protein
MKSIKPKSDEMDPFPLQIRRAGRRPEWKGEDTEGGDRQGGHGIRQQVDVMYYALRDLWNEMTKRNAWFLALLQVFQLQLGSSVSGHSSFVFAGACLSRADQV